MTAPRIAIIGTGKMGRLVAQLAGERGWPVVATIGAAGNANGQGITRERLGDAEVAVEFTAPAAAPADIIACARAHCPVVAGTTGWDAERERVEREVLLADGGLLASANFSVGVNLFWELADAAARLMAGVPGFDAHIIETHHAAKRDAPSGTARELARRAGQALGHEVPMTSVRVGSVPGTHELVFDGAFEQLRLEHVTRDRRVFAEGALAAAAWMVGRRGIFTMRDFLLEQRGAR